MFRLSSAHPGVFRLSSVHPGVFRLSSAHPGVFRLSSVHPGVFRLSSAHPGVFRLSSAHPGVFRLKSAHPGVFRAWPMWVSAGAPRPEAPWLRTASTPFIVLGQRQRVQNYCWTLDKLMASLSFLEQILLNLVLVKHAHTFLSSISEETSACSRPTSLASRSRKFMPRPTLGGFHSTSLETG